MTHHGERTSPPVRPFLKWAGGKQWLVERGFPSPSLRPGATYYEPFVGGASVFFSLGLRRAQLSDSNSELMATYRAVRDNVEEVIDRLAHLRNDPSTFAKVRASTPSSLAARAARLIYLNKTAFNGIYRVNKLGQFNVPFGNYVNPTICPEDRLRAASAALKVASLRTLNYVDAVRGAVGGDLVYFDPPYVTGHNNNGFVKYNAHLFRWADQQKLASTAARLQQAGVHVVISNAAHQAVLDLYKDFRVTRLDRSSRIAGGMSGRGVVEEVLLTTFDVAV